MNQIHLAVSAGKLLEVVGVASNEAEEGTLPVTGKAAAAKSPGLELQFVEQDQKVEKLKIQQRNGMLKQCIRK